MEPAHAKSASPVVAGAALALLSAAAFGVTTPLIGRFGASAGPWTVAALLYAGAIAGTLPSIRPGDRERRLRTADVRRVALAGVLGAALAPALLAWGIAHTGALSASLVLALESVFTVAIAAVVFHEHVGPRIAGAAALIALGTLAVFVGNGSAGAASAGVLAVAAATLLWALDSAIVGTVADADSGTIVVVKSLVGTSLSVAAAFVARESWPGSTAAVGLIAIGALGYGASLRWYVLAQRTFGIARTASVFAAAPLIGALSAYALGSRVASGPFMLAGAALTALGIALHVSERHGRLHHHRALLHEHAHRHDDGHHLHVHAVQPAGEHTHRHRHEPLVHDHPPSLEAHEDHVHETH